MYCFVFPEGTSFVFKSQQTQLIRFFNLSSFIFIPSRVYSQNCNLSLSLQCSVGSWIHFLTACNTLFHCMPQNQNYRPVLLQTGLDTICCHEYLIWCRRECSKYSPSSVFFFSFIFFYIFVQKINTLKQISTLQFLCECCHQELLCIIYIIVILF